MKVFFNLHKIYLNSIIQLSYNFFNNFQTLNINFLIEDQDMIKKLYFYCLGFIKQLDLNLGFYIN